MRILFDVDGVICDYVAWWRKCAEAVLPHPLKESGRGRSWKMEERYELTEREHRAIQREIYTTSPESMQAIPGALLQLPALMHDHDVHFATTSMVPNPLWEHGRRRWFRKHLGSDAARRLIFLRYKYVISADVLVDDKPSAIAEWNAYAPKGTALLFGQINGDSADATDWRQLYEYIAQMARDYDTLRLLRHSRDKEI